MLAHPAGCQDGLAPLAARPDPLQVGACPWVTDESDASACVRPDAAWDAKPERPDAAAEKLAGREPDVPELSVPVRPVRLRKPWVQRVLAAPYKPDGDQSAARSCAAVAFAAAPGPRTSSPSEFEATPQLAAQQLGTLPPRDPSMRFELAELPPDSQVSARMRQAEALLAAVREP